MAPHALQNLGAFGLQVFIIASAATVLLGALRIGSPAVRYLCWRVVLVACLMMPLLLQRPGEPTASALGSGGMAIQATGADETVHDAAALTEASAAPVRPSFPWNRLVLAVIAAGILVRGIWLAVGLLRLRVLRRHGVRVDDPEYREIQQALGTHADIRAVAGLAQPATFGFWRSVVLVPESLAESPAPIRRAVVTHELFHVTRRDWLWVLAEEALRSALWFHPAIAFVTSRVQLAREELVDELTVLATADRRAYIEALLVFADGGLMRPAPAFARRRHLFTRILRLSKEPLMSSPRIVTSAVFVVAVVIGTGWYSSVAFPVVSAASGAASIDSTPSSGAGWRSVLPRYQLDRLRALADGQSAPVSPPPPEQSLPTPLPLAASAPFAQGARSGGPRPGPVAVPAPVSGTKPITPENPIPRRLASVAIAYPASLRGSGYRGSVRLRVTLDMAGTISDVQRLSVELAGGSSGSDRESAAAAFFDAAAEGVRQWRYQSPADPPIAFFVTARFDGENDAAVTQSESPAATGSATVRFSTNDYALGRAAGLEARLQALRALRERLAAERSSQDPQVFETDKQIGELERELERARLDTVARGNEAVLRAQLDNEKVQLLGRPVRVGGNIAPPTKIKDVKPEYPPVAETARVQGVVILEATIDEQGHVADTRVLRSIPLLDQAAIDAVRQWEFTPTMLNGVPVPVIMTMTVQFTLAQ